jgi:Fe-S-cluster containining protein
MDACKSCQGLCCKRGNIMIFHDEYERLVKFKPAIPHSDYDLIKHIHGPCPFLENDRCTIYEERPITCRKYPLFIKFEENLAKIGCHPQCPPFSKTEIMTLKTVGDIFKLEGISEREYLEMFNAILEQDARIRLAEELLSVQRKKQFKTFLNEDRVRFGTHEVIFLHQYSIEEYNSMVSAFVFELLQKKSYTSFLEMNYKKNLANIKSRLNIQ